MKVICWEREKLGPFFGQNRLFWLKFGHFVKKSKNRPKNRVFDFFGLKMKFFSRKPVLKSYAVYKKLKSPKTKKLGPFFSQNWLFQLKFGDFVKKSKNH